MSSKLRRVGSVLAAGAAAAVAMGLVSTMPAWAITSVGCTDNNFVHVRSHTGSNPNGDLCLANGGQYNLRPAGWVDYIWTGNNNVSYHDCNGATVNIGKYTTYNPANDFCATSISIV